MDAQSSQALSSLILSRSVGALGTLRDGAPYVSMVLCVPSRDLSGFLIHISRLAHHTQNMLTDPRVSLMIVASEQEHEDPQALPRVSIQGVAEEIPSASREFKQAAEAYLARIPQATTYLALGDFSFFRIVPHTIRFVAGFGRAFSVTPRQLKDIALGGT